jgi:hypothetical protein
MYRVQRARLPGAENATDQQIVDVIREAGRTTGWVIEPVAPGRLRGMYSKGRHSAVVAIKYSKYSFDIDYLESANLKHDNDKIHKAYNSWVKKLETAIQREATFRLQQ